MTKNQKQRQEDHQYSDLYGIHIGDQKEGWKLTDANEISCQGVWSHGGIAIKEISDKKERKEKKKSKH